MNTLLWVVQALLASMMIVLGYMKTFRPVESLYKFSWTTRSSRDRIRFIGFSELMIGLGLILPTLTGITPKLTSLAAVFLTLIMVLAILEHVKNNEKNEIWKNVFLLFLALFVAVGRY